MLYLDELLDIVMSFKFAAQFKDQNKLLDFCCFLSTNSDHYLSDKRYNQKQVDFVINSDYCEVIIKMTRE